MPPRLGRIVRRKGASRGRLQAERLELKPIRGRIEADAVRDRQARLPERSEIRGFRTEPAESVASGDNRETRNMGKKSQKCKVQSLK